MSNLNTNKYIFSAQRRGRVGMLMVMPRRMQSDSMFTNMMRPLSVLLNRVSTTQV